MAQKAHLLFERECFHKQLWKFYLTLDKFMLLNKELFKKGLERTSVRDRIAAVYCLIIPEMLRNVTQKIDCTIVWKVDVDILSSTFNKRSCVCFVLSHCKLYYILKKNRSNLKKKRDCIASENSFKIMSLYLSCYLIVLNELMWTLKECRNNLQYNLVPLQSKLIWFRIFLDLYKVWDFRECWDTQYM